MPTKKPMDMTGEKYGRLLVIGYSHKEGNYHYYNCICDCSERMDKRPVAKIKGKLLRDGSTKSCGCLRSQHAQNLPKGNKSIISMELIKQMPCYSKLYEKWNSYWHMCYNAETENYKFYGDKGIVMCPQWADRSIGILFFYTWAMQQGFEKGDRVERINKRLDYSPENCKITKPKSTQKPIENKKTASKGKKKKQVESNKSKTITPVTFIKNDIILLSKDNIEVKLGDIIDALGHYDKSKLDSFKPVNEEKTQKTQESIFIKILKKIFKSA